MTTRHAACSCGQLHLTIEGESVRISTCHCLACQRRTGAVFSNQASFRREQHMRPERSVTKSSTALAASDFALLRLCVVGYIWTLARNCSRIRCGNNIYTSLTLSKHREIE
jgi:hypothetical protein